MIDVKPTAPSVNAAGTPGNNGTPDDAINKLRQKHADAVSGGPRLNKDGTPRKQWTRRAEPAPAPADPLKQEGVNKKMGMAWRAAGYGMALSTNCNVWLLDEEQERMLGEAYGDLCAHLGFTDSLAFKIVFCVGVTVGIFGGKTAQYTVFIRQMRAEQEKQKKNLQPDKPKEPEPGQVHESKPGVI